MFGHLVSPRRGGTGRPTAQGPRAGEAGLPGVESGEVLTTTRFNVAELWVGIERTRDRRGEVVAVETMLEPLTILDFDESSARVFGRITAHLYAHGSPRGDMDILIASVVLVHGDRLVTRNTRHFAGIPELVVETY